jgi:hypothetical protein
VVEIPPITYYFKLKENITMTTEILWAYEAYCIDCIWEGIAPKSLPQWLDESKN